jgi:hypothetical protein
MELSVRPNASHLLHVLAVGITAMVIWSALGASAYGGVVTTGSILKTAKTTIAGQTGVHVVSTATSSTSSSTERIIADVGASSGTESVSEGGARLTIRVTPTDGYISGNSSGLTDVFGLSSAEAKKAGKDWVSWKAGTSQYSDLKSAVTISSVTTLLPVAKGTKLSTVTANGAKAYVLKWTTAATSSIPKLSNTLTISAVGTTLPVEETSTTSSGTKLTTTFSKWGEHLLVSAPPLASTIAANKITG